MGANMMSMIMSDRYLGRGSLNAEHEYVLVKINLHKATELKELLSEHLCAVVHRK